MPSDHIIFAGIDIGSGRKPVTLAALDHTLKVVFLERCDLSGVMACLEPYKRVMLALTITPGGKTLPAKRGQKIHVLLKKKIAQAGFDPYLKSNAPRQWIETNPRDCFSALIGQPILPRHSLEGRIQRALILYEQGLQIRDPMDFFEETTRHHMTMGVFPNELLYSASELNALIAAYLAWSTVNKPVQVDLAGDKKDGKTLVLTEPRDE